MKCASLVGVLLRASYEESHRFVTGKITNSRIIFILTATLHVKVHSSGTGNPWVCNVH